MENSNKKKEDGKQGNHQPHEETNQKGKTAEKAISKKEAKKSTRRDK